jgi:transposase
MEQAATGRRRRFHSEEFKTQAVAACKQPGVSMASVAMANGINANLLRRWVLAATEPATKATTNEVEAIGFVALPMPATSTASTDPIRIELQRGPTKIAVTWPVSAADACVAWLRELLL